MTENVNWNIIDEPYINVRFLKTHDDSILPKVNNQSFGTGDSGYDIFSVEEVVVPARSSVVAPVGITVADISPGYWFRINLDLVLVLNTISNHI